MRLVCVLLFVELCTSLRCSGRLPSPTSLATFSELIDRYIADESVAGPSFSAVLIAANSSVVLQRGYGKQSRAPGSPSSTERTLYHMASISKTFVALAVMQLVERQLLALDDPLVKHLPYFELPDPRYKQISIRHLVSHTSGLPDVADYQFYSAPPGCSHEGHAAEHYVRSLSELKHLHSIGLVDRPSLIGAPGERYRYSNLGFDILGVVISTVSGEEHFTAYMQRHILGPMNMMDTTTSVFDSNASLLAVPHALSSFDTRSSTPISPGVMAPDHIYPDNCIHAPSSDVTSNARDMAQFALMQLAQGVAANGAVLLNRSTWEVMMTPIANVTGGGRFEKAVSVAWYRGHFHGLSTLHHSGEDDGFLTELVLVPSCGVGVVWMSNGDDEAVANQDLVDQRLANITDVALRVLLQ